MREMLEQILADHTGQTARAGPQGHRPRLHHGRDRRPRTTASSTRSSAELRLCPSSPERRRCVGRRGEAVAKFDQGGDLVKCSFCGKSQKQVKKLIAGPGRLHLRRVHRPVQRHHRGGARRQRRGPLRRAAQAQGDPRVPQRLRDRAGARQEGPLGRRLLPLQAGAVRQLPRRRRRAGEVQHLAARPDRLRQDAARPDAGPHAQRAVRHRRRHRAHRGRLRRRGRREHPPQADPGRRLRRQEGRDRASSTSTRSTRSPARARTRRSPATCPARACSRRCSRSSRARPRRCRPRAAASTPTRSSSRSTRPTSCSSAAARSPGLDKIVEARLGRRGIGFGAEIDRTDNGADELLQHVLPEDLLQVRADPRVRRPAARSSAPSPTSTRRRSCASSSSRRTR